MSNPKARTPEEAGLETVEMEVAKLRVAEYNPRKASEDEMAGIVESLKRFGTVEPIVVNTLGKRDGVIVGGHMRVEALRRMGIATVPAVTVSLKPKDERELNLRLNRTGKWDWKALARAFTSEELESVGFDDGELEMLSDEMAKDSAGEGGISDALKSAERKWTIDLEFDDQDEWMEAREWYVGQDEFERTENLIKHYAKG